MFETGLKLVENTVVRCKFDHDLNLAHARWLRGAIGQLIDRPEFHHHSEAGLVYHHPLIRYAVHRREAIIAGLAEGAFLLRSMPVLESLRLGTGEYRVLEQTVEFCRTGIGACSEPIIYSFQTPYLALNQENYDKWQRSDPFTGRRLLQRVVIGNLLSLAKAIRLDVSERLHADVDLWPDRLEEVKPGVRLLGFRGVIQVNFTLPDRWGIGKSSARGFGTLIRQEAGHGKGQSKG